MAKRIRNTGRTLRRVRHTGPTLPRVSPERVAEFLGAVEAGPAAKRSPISLLREDLAQNLRSRGGRPALEGATRRQKIPLSEASWERLVQLAEQLSADGPRTTPGQVASVLLTRALAGLTPDDAAKLRGRAS